MWLEIVDNPKHKGPIENPFDVEPTLAALVSLGELQQVDLVLPRVFVTEEVHLRLHYLFQKHHHNIAYWTYDTQSRFGTSGRQPLQMQIWYLPAGTESVLEVVETLEKRFAAKEDGERGKLIKTSPVSRYVPSNLTMLP